MADIPQRETPAFYLVAEQIEKPGNLGTMLRSADAYLHRLKMYDFQLMNSLGIPKEDRLNIFTRFYRVDKARSRASGGSGLGLSIVHDAVIAHGGTITVGSNPNGEGSVFLVRFPRPSAEETGI